ncbi:MAG: trigger factor [Candidatus Buchananbacteria bacterium RBG_13_36_9]|uniref:Trigger factor n=1 Tax=Candidatus Buchananbacteria bacterium RBG_13_36_9 TaxID=1797530 RepID=A0A1G1XN83_9BACT|nr:MAG: trigger factor [Candidatus Buchananbacteria bacterium RBG_13_36_9]
MNYNYEIKKLPKSQVEITVTVPWAELNPFIEKAALKLSEQTKIDGFRPGKVPFDILKARVGEMKIYEEAAALAVEKSYVEIATKEKLEPLGSPQINFEKLAANNDFVYKAIVNLVPEIKIGDIKSVKIKEKEIKVTDEDINKIIEEVRNQKATEVLENKAVEKGDKVEIDFDIFRDNVPIESGAQKKYPLIVGLGHFIPGFEEQLIGLKTNEEKEFELTFPEKYHNNNLAGKPAKFKVKLLAVYKRTLPELNDDFAKGLGIESMVKLKEQVHHNVEHEEHHKEEERVEIEMLEKLIDKSQFGELPDILINAEVNKMLQELESNIARQGLKFEDYLKHLNKTTEQMKLEFVPQAIKRVKGALLTRAIFFQEKMEIPENEIDREIEAAGKMYQQYPDMLKNFKTPEYREYIRNLIGNNKVMDFLKAICVERTNPEHKC